MSVPPPPPGSDIPPQAPLGVAPGYDGAVSSDDRTMAMIAHILGIFTAFIGPLIIYFIKKDQSKFVANQAMQATIFQGAIFIGYIIGGVLAVIGIGFLINLALWILSIVFAIIGGMAANKGQWYSYPATGNFANQQANKI